MIHNKSIINNLNTIKKEINLKKDYFFIKKNENYKNIINVKLKNKERQNNICHRVAPSNDFTIKPPKLKQHAPIKTSIGPGILLIIFI